MNNKKTTFIIAGLVLFLTMLLIPPPFGMTPKMWKMAAVVVLMAVWWLTEAVELSVTALLPIVLLPILGITGGEQVTLSYANNAIYLFMGGFLLAMAIERCELHKRFAFYTLKVVGNSPRKIILGFMLATYTLSMWVSNTATVLMMIPIAIALTQQLLPSTDQKVKTHRAEQNFAKSPFLSIAYAASIGGVATLIGTPPNIILSSIVERTNGIEIGFSQWMLLALPLSLVFLFISWFLITSKIYPVKNISLPFDTQIINQKIADLGPMSTYEKRVLTLFSITALMWTLRGIIKIPFFEQIIDDTTIAIAAAITLFFIIAVR